MLPTRTENIVKPSHHPQHDRVAAAAIAVLDQCAAFISDLDADAYTTPSPLQFGSTIGQHVRHELGHFAAAHRGGPAGLIDYDHRERDTVIDRARAAALAEMKRLRSWLASAGRQEGAPGVRVRVMLAGDGSFAELDSTLPREVFFAMHHAIHHHAIMGAIAAEQGLPVPAGFGKAPSTVNHEQRLAGSA